MTTKQSIDDIVAKTFVGKKFISSEFTKLDEMLLNSVGSEFALSYYKFETDVKVADIVGKTIKEVEIIPVSYCDVGIALKFEEFRHWLFFYIDDAITVED